MLLRIYRKVRDLFLSGQRVKSIRELESWQKAYSRSGEEFGNEYYQFFYTEAFGLNDDFYEGKAVLDIGCGPRGSLEWGAMMNKRVGLDPLADSYQEFGINKHAMEYVNSGCEEMPFDDEFFDVVTSFNSLDHVDDIKKSLSEIARVTKKGGTFLLLTDIHEKPTKLEPQAFSWDITDGLDAFAVEEVKQLEKSVPDNIYESIRRAVSFDHGSNKSRYGILLCRSVKK